MTMKMMITIKIGVSMGTMIRIGQGKKIRMRGRG